MKIERLAALAVLAALCAAPAQALPENVPPPAAYAIIQDTATVVNVTVSNDAFTSMGTLSGGHYVIVQTTDAVAGFACSFEVGASTLGVAGVKGSIRAKKEPGGTFYELEIKRWARDLALKCITLATHPKTLAILQGR